MAGARNPNDGPEGMEEDETTQEYEEVGTIEEQLAPQIPVQQPPQMPIQQTAANREMMARLYAEERMKSLPENTRTPEMATVFMEQYHREELLRSQLAAQETREKLRKEKAANRGKELKKKVAAKQSMDISEVHPGPANPPSAHTPQTPGTEKSTKRTIESVIDPDTGKDMPDPKRSNIPLDKGIKRVCLKAILEFFNWLSNEILRQIGEPDCIYNVNISNALVSIIFTTHNIIRQKHNSTSISNMQQKSASTDFPVSYKSKTYHIQRKTAEKAWMEIIASNGLNYNIDKDSPSNWIGTMGPYLNMLGCWGLRLQELRVGHTKMPVARDGDKLNVVPIEKYGLSPAHAVHLEGITYPPERKASMSMSLGALTTVLCMLRTKGKYRKKWEMAVKKTLSHIPAISDFIALTESNSSADHVKPALSLLGDILLITTSRQSQRGCIPVCMLNTIYQSLSTVNKAEFLDIFDLSGKGLFYIYKLLQESNQKFNIEMDGTEEEAAQIVFHTIFGTYKEDLGVLKTITTTGSWRTRQELGKSFAKTKGTVRQFTLPTLKYYSKLCSANQSEFHTSNTGQVVSVPCFSGSRRVTFGEDFYEHMKRDKSSSQSVKTMTNIINIWSAYVTDLLTKVQKNKVNKYGTKSWCEMSGLDGGRDGAEVTLQVEAAGRFFLSRD